MKSCFHAWKENRDFYLQTKLYRWLPVIKRKFFVPRKLANCLIWILNNFEYSLVFHNSSCFVCYDFGQFYEIHAFCAIFIHYRILRSNKHFAISFFAYSMNIKISIKQSIHFWISGLLGSLLLRYQTKHESAN